MTLHSLVLELGVETVTPLGLINDERPVCGAEFFDAHDDFQSGAAVLFLVPSITGIPQEQLDAFAAKAKRNGCAAIAMKCAQADEPGFEQLARKHELTFLRVDDRVSWRMFDALLAQVLGERRHVEDAHRDRGAEPLFALANELAGFFGGSVAIEDLGRRIIAYSSVPGQLIDTLRTEGILRRHVPDSPYNDDQYRTVLRSTAPLKFSRQQDEEARVVAPIRAGSLPLGTIWAIDATGDPPLSDLQATRILQAADVAAAHMLNDIQARKATQAPREERMRRLIEGHCVSGSELAELGIPEERGAAVLGFQLAPRTPASALTQLKSTVQRHLSLYRPETVTIEREGRVYAMVSEDPARPLPTLVSPLLPILDRLIGSGTIVVHPGVALTTAGVASVCQLADQMLAVGARESREEVSVVLTLADLRPKLLFTKAVALFAMSPELSSPGIAQMSSNDPAVAETLAMWCGFFGNVAETARALGIHENTVRYRLRRARERYGVDFASTDELLACWLQLRAARETPLPPE